MEPTTIPAATETSTVLIVDDSRTQLELLRYILEQSGHRVIAASGGEEALGLARESRPSLVISDIVMPGMDGYQLCRALKEDGALASTPVMLLTQLVEVRDILMGLQAQADFYLTKPYDPDYLLTRVRGILDTPPRLHAADPLAALEVTLDGIGHRVHADRQQMLNLLLSTYGNAVQQNRELSRARDQLQDLNEQLQEQAEQLQLSERNHRALLESSGDAMVVVDQSLRMRFLNPAALSLFRTSCDELLEEPFPYPLTLGPGAEVTIPGAPGEPVIAELRVVETQWQGADASLVSLHNITERKRYEEQITLHQQKLQEANDVLQSLATTDGLTGLKNHRAFKERLLEEYQRALRYKAPLSLLLLDVDKFKSYNDTFGHPAGDDVLKIVARLLLDKARDIDFVARYGGEEFVLLLPNTAQPGALIVAERLRQSLQTEPWPQRTVTASFGASSLSAETAESGDLIAAADRALYYSKAAGRNRCTHVDDLP